MIKKAAKVIKELGHLTPMALIMLFLPMLGTLALLVFLQPIGDWLRENWEIGTLAFFTATVLLCGLSLLPTNVIGLVAGWSFGFWLGLLILIGAIVGAAVLSFFIHSRISGRKLPETFSKHIKVDAIYQTLLREDYWRTTFIIFLLRVSVIMPFAFTNFLLASARVPLSSYIVGTIGGMLPRSAAMVFAGAGLSALDPQNSRDMVAITIGIVATLATIIIIARLSRNALVKIAEEESRREIAADASY
jgi:uncharacterized membrane protein YdjX (TVP38/TMEM64 family)